MNNIEGHFCCLKPFNTRSSWNSTNLL